MSQALSRKNKKRAPKACAVRTKMLIEAVDLFGDSWTLFIINALSSGEKRFCELEREVEGINPTTLSGRLKKLEHAGFIERREETMDKLSVAYSLTRKGKGMKGVLKSIESYAEKHLG